MANAAGLVVSAPKAVREGRWSPVIDRVEHGPDRQQARRGPAGGAGRARRRPAGRHRRRRAPPGGDRRAARRLWPPRRHRMPAATCRTSW